MKGGTAAVLAALMVAAPGCGSNNDACKGMRETCLSLTLLGSEGVSQADQLEVLLSRQSKGRNPSMALGSPQDFPFKVAVLWPDGGATVSVRSYLNGQLTGVSAELSLDLRDGAHDKQALTLYPPVSGPSPTDLAGRDLGTQRPGDMTSPRDMATPDLARPDLAASDMATPPDMATPDLATPDLGMPDMDGPDLSVPDMAVPDLFVTADMAMPGG